MDFSLLSNLALGFDTALSLQNILYCTVGVTIGTLIGVLPGMGPVATVAMLLPATYALPPTSALIMLAGIYYGAQYGGSTTAILVNIPGEAAAVVTCLDGHMMAKAGRAGAALGIAAIGSFFAGCTATLLIAAFAPPLTELAFQFGPAEYFSLMVLGLVSSVVLATGSLLKAICMVLLGLLLGLVGTDVNSGAMRFTFGIDELQDGIDFVPLSMGLFGFAEIMRNLEGTFMRTTVTAKLKSVLPTWNDLKVSFGPIVRGTALGSVLGVLPGGGAALGLRGAEPAPEMLPQLLVARPPAPLRQEPHHRLLAQLGWLRHHRRFPIALPLTAAQGAARPPLPPGPLLRAARPVQSRGAGAPSSGREGPGRLSEAAPRPTAFPNARWVRAAPAPAPPPNDSSRSPLGLRRMGGLCRGAPSCLAALRPSRGHGRRGAAGKSRCGEQRGLPAPARCDGRGDGTTRGNGLQGRNGTVRYDWEPTGVLVVGQPKLPGVTDVVEGLRGCCEFPEIRCILDIREMLLCMRAKQWVPRF